MVQFTRRPFFEGLARRSISLKKTDSARNDDDAGREAAEELAKEAKRTHLISRSSSSTAKSDFVTSVSSREGKKGVNQDCVAMWKEFGFQDDMVFCGVFDGHGPWGHFVSKRVSKLLPTLLLWYWQETLARCSPKCVEPAVCSDDGSGLEFEVWKKSYVKACATVDKELEESTRFDSLQSGTTALTLIKQGDLLIVSNVGDSRAVLATTGPTGALEPVQLTTDFKPNLPSEAERITQSQGRVYCLDDEPGIYRLWQPRKGSPGLAVSRAFGDHCLKSYGLISVPDVVGRRVSVKDRFVILATDGVWDVVSNKEAVEIVSSAPKRVASAKRLVTFAARAWKVKRPGVAVDDISAVCLYLNDDGDDESLKLSQYGGKDMRRWATG